MISISSAFRLRNRLKEKIQRLNGLIIERAVYEKTVGEEENRAPLDGQTLQETIAESSGLMDLLCEFNKAIEKANEVNRADLVTLESIKAKIAFYTQIAAKCRGFKGFDYEYPAERKSSYDDAMVKVIKEPVLDQAAIVNELSALKKAKNALEDKLSRSNSVPLVDFDAERISAAL